MTPSSAQPSLVGSPVFTDNAHDGTVQRSMIQMIQLTFDNFVYFGIGALTVTRVAGETDGVTGDMYHGAIATKAPTITFNVASGQFVYSFGFTGTNGLEATGSLEDGNYTLALKDTAITTLLGGGGQSVNPASTMGTTMPSYNFWRLYGDALGTGQVTSADQTLFLRSNNTRTGMANYYSYFDYDGNGIINNTDYAAFLKRLNAYSTPL